ARLRLRLRLLGRRLMSGAGFGRFGIGRATGGRLVGLARRWRLSLGVDLSSVGYHDALSRPLRPGRTVLSTHFLSSSSMISASTTSSGPSCAALAAPGPGCWSSAAPG